MQEVPYWLGAPKEPEAPMIDTETALSMCEEALRDEIDWAEDLKEVLLYYIKSNDWAEPIGWDGRCNFCGRLRADAYGEHDDHQPTCKWLTVSARLMYEESEHDVY